MNLIENKIIQKVELYVNVHQQKLIHHNIDKVQIKIKSSLCSLEVALNTNS